jgi:uncharacterized protein (TIGR00251 family)
MVNNDWYNWKSGDLLLKLKVQTKACAEGFAELLDDRIKLRIKAAAVDGKANEAIIKLLSKEFRAPKSQITILSGHSSKKKIVKIVKPGRLPDIAGLEQEAQSLTNIHKLDN